MPVAGVYEVRDLFCRIRVNDPSKPGGLAGASANQSTLIGDNYDGYPFYSRMAGDHLLCVIGLKLIELAAVVLPGKVKWRQVFRTYVDSNISVVDAYHVLACQRIGVKEIKPLAQSLSQLGDIGLEAVSYLKLGMPPPREWRDATLVKVDEATKPYGALEFVVIPSVKQLVNAAAEIKR